MQDFNTVYDFSYEIPDEVLIEPDLLFFEVEINVSFTEVLHNDVNFVLVLESFPNGDKDVTVAYLLDGFTLH